MKKTLFILMLVLPYIIVSSVFAVTDKAMTVNASVTASTIFDVKIYKSLSATTYDWTTNLYPTMNFGALVNAIPGDPTSALAATMHYVALVSVTNNSGASYYVQYAGNPLRHTDAVTLISNDAFTAVGGLHYNTDGSLATVYSPGLNTTLKSAGITTPYSVYTSNTTGTSDIFRVYFGITGDPTKGVDANSNGQIDLIPPGQKAGSYTASVKLSLYP